jgi:hypothetical protein
MLIDDADQRLRLANPVQGISPVGGKPEQLKVRSRFDGAANRQAYTRWSMVRLARSDDAGSPEHRSQLAPPNA